MADSNASSNTASARKSTYSVYDSRQVELLVVPVLTGGNTMNSSSIANLRVLCKQSFTAAVLKVLWLKRC
jgi:hypothetical protein